MEENQAPEQQVEESTDWQAKYEAMRAHSREWEKKAKANQGAADELEKLRAEQMSEQEREKARADAAEAELAALRAEKERADAARRISSEKGVPLELLMYCRDEESMTEFAKAYEAETHVSSAPSALAGNRIVRGGEGKRSNRDIFAQFAAENLKF